MAAGFTQVYTGPLDQSHLLQFFLEPLQEDKLEAIKLAMR